MQASIDDSPLMQTQTKMIIGNPETVANDATSETRDTLSATNLHGDKWTGEMQDGLYVYMDQQGNLYESKERPAYRIVIDKALFTVEGIAPLHI